MLVVCGSPGVELCQQPSIETEQSAQGRFCSSVLLIANVQCDVCTGYQVMPLTVHKEDEVLESIGFCATLIFSMWELWVHFTEQDLSTPSEGV